MQRGIERAGTLVLVRATLSNLIEELKKGKHVGDYDDMLKEAKRWRERVDSDYEAMIKEMSEAEVNGNEAEF